MVYFTLFLVRCKRSLFAEGNHSNPSHSNLRQPSSMEFEVFFFCCLHKNERNFVWLCNHISIQPLALCIFWCGAHTHTWNGNKKKTVNETRNQSKKFYRRWNLCGAMKNICFFLSLFEYIMCLAECWTICYSEWSSYIQLISELSQFKALKRRKIERHRARERQRVFIIDERN